MEQVELGRIVEALLHGSHVEFDFEGPFPVLVRLEPFVGFFSEDFVHFGSPRDFPLPSPETITQADDHVAHQTFHVQTQFSVTYR